MDENENRLDQELVDVVRLRRSGTAPSAVVAQGEFACRLKSTKKDLELGEDEKGSSGSGSG